MIKTTGRFTILGFLAIMIGAAVIAQEGPIIREVIISGEGIKNPDQIRRILPFREGDPYELENIAKAASILKKTGLFEQISIDEKHLPDGVRVVITLTPVRFIKSIEFQKSFPLFESALRRAIHTREGDPFVPEKIEQDVKRLEAYLQNRGYFESEVEASAQPEPKTGDVILTFSIKKGFTYNLLDVRSEGNRVITDNRIRLIIRRQLLLRYRKESLEEGIENLLKLYHSRGYYEARVRLESIDLDPLVRTVVVNLEIHEGPRARVVIKGDRHVRKRTLRKQLVLAEEESIGEFDVETSAFRMADIYRSRGYRDVQVNWDINQEEGQKGTLHVITFDIEPGRRVVIGKIIFHGRQQFRTKKLQKQMLTGRSIRFWRKPALEDSVLEEDIRALRAFYHSWGFEEVEVSGPELEFNKKGDRVRVIIRINEGPQTMVGEVTFEGMEHFEHEWAIAALRLVPGSPYDAALLAEDKRRLLLQYANSGFPYAKVSQHVEDLDTPEGRAVAIRYTIIEDTRVCVGELVLRGNYRTRARVLTREIELTSGEPFSYEELLSSRRNLRTLAFLNTVRLDTLGLEEHLDVAHLLLQVQERPSRTVDFGMGYDSEDGPLLSFATGDLNLFGLGKAGRVEVSGGGDINEMEVSYIDPRFLGWRIRADLTASGAIIKREAFDLSQAAGRFALARQVTQLLTLMMGLRTEWNILSSVVDQEAVDDFDVSENSLIAIGPQLLYDSRDDFIDPTRGYLLTLKVEYGMEYINQDHWVGFFAQGSTYYGIVGRVVLAASARYGHIEPIEDSLIPLQEVFFVGGNRSVRGYSEDGLGPRSPDGDPLGGLDMVVTNLEIRFPIYSVFGGVVFVDSGQLVIGGQKLALSQQLFTAGTGLRIFTPVGPIRIDWGYKLEPSPFERRWQWHFSFGYPF